MAKNEGGIFGLYRTIWKLKRYMAMVKRGEKAASPTWDARYIRIVPSPELHRECLYERLRQTRIAKLMVRYKLVWVAVRKTLRSWLLSSDC